MNRVEVARVDARIVRLQSARDVQRLAPSSYRTDAVLWNGELVTYHSLQKTELIQRLRKQRFRDSPETEGLH